MKKYNIQNYIRYKEDLKTLKPKGDIWNYFDRTEVIHKYLPLVENLARKFSTSDQASGILSILDLIQEGSIGLILAVDKLDWTELEPSKDIDQTLKSFFSKRIKGAIRRRIDMHRGNMRIPEHRLNKMRKNGGKDKKMVEMFFNSIFLSIDSKNDATGESFANSIEDPISEYNVEILNAYLLSLMFTYLNQEIPFWDFEITQDESKTNRVKIVDKQIPDASSNHLFLALGSTETLKGSI